MHMQLVVPPMFCGAADVVDPTRDDLILRSSDNVDFRVSKHTLSKFSAIFSDMCSIPHPSLQDSSLTPVNEEVPVVPVAEQSDMLAKFLESIAANGSTVTFNSLSEIRDFYCVADKYVSDEAMDAAKAALIVRAHTTPFEVYLMACELGLEEEARQAARRVLRFPLESLKELAGDQVAAAPTPVLERLWAYHQECRIAVAKLTDCDFWAVQDLKIFPCVLFDPRIPPPPSVFSLQPRCCTTIQTGSEVETYHVKTWFLPYLSELAKLLSAKPSGEDLGFGEWSALYKDAVAQAKQCPRCGEHAFELLRMYSKSAFARLNSLISAVRLEFRAFY